MSSFLEPYPFLSGPCEPVFWMELGEGGYRCSPMFLFCSGSPLKTLSPLKGFHGHDLAWCPVISGCLIPRLAYLPLGYSLWPLGITGPLLLCLQWLYYMAYWWGCLSNGWCVGCSFMGSKTRTRYLLLCQGSIPWAMCPRSLYSFSSVLESWEWDRDCFHLTEGHGGPWT